MPEAPQAEGVLEVGQLLGELVEGTDPEGVMQFGIGAGALVLALAAFQYATRSGKGGGQ